MIIRFEGRAAERIWRNIEDHVSYADTVASLLKSNRTVEAELLLQTLIWLCYGGTSVRMPVSDTEVKEYIDQRRQIQEVDPGFYKLVTSHQSIVLEVKLGKVTKSLNFGNYVGYSAVLAINEQGFREYVNNEIPGFKLGSDTSYLVPKTHNKKASEFLYISSVVHLPSLVRLFSVDEEPEQPLSSPVQSADECYEAVFRTDKKRKAHRKKLPIVGSEVLNTTLQQIRSMIVPMKIVTGDRLVTSPAYRLPVILCPISGKGEGAFLVGKAGFWPSDTDARGYLRYKLDFARYNDPSASEEERVYIRLAVRYLS